MEFFSQFGTCQQFKSNNRGYVHLLKIPANLDPWKEFIVG